MALNWPARCGGWDTQPRANRLAHPTDHATRRRASRQRPELSSVEGGIAQRFAQRHRGASRLERRGFAARNKAVKTKLTQRRIKARKLSACRLWFMQTVEKRLGGQEDHPRSPTRAMRRTEAPRSQLLTLSCMREVAGTPSTACTLPACHSPSAWPNKVRYVFRA